jgi:hypothetical protein
LDTIVNYTPDYTSSTSSSTLIPGAFTATPAFTSLTFDSVSTAYTSNPKENWVYYKFAWTTTKRIPPSGSVSLLFDDATFDVKTTCAYTTTLLSDTVNCSYESPVKYDSGDYHRYYIANLPLDANGFFTASTAMDMFVWLKFRAAATTDKVVLISNAYDTTINYIIEIVKFDIGTAAYAATVGVDSFKAPYPEAVVSADQTTDADTTFADIKIKFKLVTDLKPVYAELDADGNPTGTIKKSYIEIELPKVETDP